MLVLRYSGLLALLATTAFAGKSIKDVTTLKPITKQTNLQARSDDDSVAPSTNITLDYGVDAQPMVHVDLQMQTPTVLLEDIASVNNVTCVDGTLTVTFKNTEGFSAAVASWSNKGDLVFFTNHLGGCDTEVERGVFLVNQFSSDVKDLTVTAHSEKKDVASTAAQTVIEFQGVPVAKKRRSVAKREKLDPRGISVSENGLTIGGTVGIPDGTSIYSFPPYLEVSADTASITASVTFSGKVDYNILGGKLNQLYVDVDSSIDAEVGVTLTASAEYRDSFTYSPSKLSYMIVDVPGIITLGPELLFDVGLDVDVGAGVTVTGTAGVGLQNGRIHLDFLDMNQTTAQPWQPTHNAQLDLSEKAWAKADTWVDVTFQLVVEVLAGVVDLNAGLTARPRFNNEFAFTASQSVNETGGVTQPDDTVCAQGLSLQSDFSFSLTAFVSSLWSRSLYNVQVPIADKCYTWLGSSA
ncbi:hypothetical protein MCOR25_009680 [Pyricularia grisea]|uniref:DUF7029 domain-containing protein n=1 Tax=Pyricularia grisea TaxID=148305 RepID=A0A6P8BGI5_PYRGI|nr:uncharacterized protein PgNI_00050 [Pyricularia grisea]KAI6351917.1 hypothetical protein MCOR25_009680 [Pyricularia grisea]TLD15976.1 hypothetical protein PgNI_00050 [Pyricularia grisea]